MDSLPQKIAEYRYLIEQEKQLTARKHQLRDEILQELQSMQLNRFAAQHGIAKVSTRFKLIPHTEELLALLTPEDLMAFAHFSSEKVKELLVPKYGREKLLAMFDIEKSTVLSVSPPPAALDKKEPPF